MRIIALEEHVIDPSLAKATQAAQAAEAGYMVDLGGGDSPPATSKDRPTMAPMPQIMARAGDMGAGRIAEMDAHGIDMQILSYSNATQLAGGGSRLRLGARSQRQAGGGRPGSRGPVCRLRDPSLAGPPGGRRRTGPGSARVRRQGSVAHRAAGPQLPGRPTLRARAGQAERAERTALRAPGRSFAASAAAVLQRIRQDRDGAAVAVRLGLAQRGRYPGYPHDPGRRIRPVS